MKPPSLRETFDDEAIRAFEPTTKIGLIATIGENGRPHLSLITSLYATGPRKMAWGQFTEGFSKRNVRERAPTAFLILTLDRRMWRGKATWTHQAHEGAEYEALNAKPMFRYNSYFGIHTVHYMDLIGTRGREALPMKRIVLSSVVTTLLRRTARSRDAGVMNPFTQGMFNDLKALKFLAYVEPDGHPWIIPLIQAQCAGDHRLLFAPLAYAEELGRVPAGAPVAVFAMNLKMEDVMVGGRYTGVSYSRLAPMGGIEVESVYNSMPPNHGPIYPPVPLERVERW